MSTDHDPHHYHDYRNWAEKAKANGSEDAGALLEEGAALRCYWRLCRSSAIGVAFDYVCR